MAIHHLTPPIRGGERPRLPSSQRGPVSVALAAMHAADPDRQRIRKLRRRIAERIEADIALLDALDVDCDLEEDNPAGGNINDEPRDPEEDACAAEDVGHYLSGFDGNFYRPLHRRRFA